MGCKEKRAKDQIIEKNNKLEIRTSLVAQWQRILLSSRIHSLRQEDPLEKKMATHSSILAWEITWTVEPGRLEFIGLQNSQAQLGD